MSVVFPASAFVPADEAPPSAPTLLALRDRIAAIASGVEAPFIDAGSMLMEVIEALDRIIAQLDAVSGAIDRPAASASVADLKRVADRLMALPQIHKVRAARMNDVADAAKDLAGNLTMVGRTLRIMDIFGMNIGVASEGEPAFTGFVSHMSEKLADGERDLAGMAAQLATLTASVAAMRKAEQDLSAESSKVVPHVPLRLIDDATTLEDHLAASALAAGQVAAAARRVRDQVAVMLGALQVGDRTRQRLEHIAVGLEQAQTCRTSGTTMAAVAHFERMLIAQITATALAFDSDALVLTDAFHALQPDTQHLLELLAARTAVGGGIGSDGKSGESKGGGGGSIGELEHGISEVMHLTTRLCAADDRARAMHDLIANAIADINRRLEGIRRLRGNVQVLATNIALLCRRHGQIGRGVSAIADQIDVQAGVLPQLTENIVRPIDTLVAVSSAMQRELEGAEAVDAVTILSSAVSILSEGARRSDAASQRHRGDDGKRLIAMVGNAATKIEQERSLTQQIRDCAALLAAQSPDAGEPDDDDLAALVPVLQSIGALYTMAQEREIQARFSPPGLVEVPAEAVPDEDDDGLF